MAKLLKIIGRTISRIVGITLEWVMLFVILFAFLIRTSSFQTYLGDVATSYLSSELNTELHIGKIEVVFLDQLLLKDVYVEDLKKDTLVSVGEIDVKLQTLNLSGNSIIISSVLIDNGRIGINRDKKTGEYNYQFIADYFSSDKPKKKKSKPFDVLVKEISLNKIDLSYEDFRKEHMPYGLDYDYLHFRNVNLTMNHFVSENGLIGFNIDKFTAVEQCGLNLQMLKLRAQIDPKKGVLLNKITIQTPTTAIYASHFNLRVKSFDDFSKFNSKVIFDASIDSSKVDLKDVSYFVPALEGMDQTIALKAALSKPLERLTISDLDLRFGARSIVRGNFVLPDFSQKDQAKLSEDLQYCFVDLDDVKSLHLPKSAGMKSIELQPMIDQLKFVELREVKVNGQMKQFVMSSEKIGTDLGNIRLNNGIQFTSLKEGGYAFVRTANSDFDVYVDSFQLGNFIDQDIFGSVTGSAFLTGVVGQKDGIRLTELSGDFQKFGFNKYTYTNIKVYEGSFIDNVFKSKIDIDDPHLAMKFDGFIDVNKKQKFDFDLDVTKADLGALNFDSDPNASLVAGLDINLTGTGINDYSGTVTVDKLVFKENGKTIESPQMDLALLRGATEDHFLLKSDVADIDMMGKITLGNIATALNNSFAELLPTIITPMKMTKGGRKEFFHGTITLKNTEQIFALYYPELHIAPGTTIDLSYDSQADTQEMTVKSKEVALIPVGKDTSAVQKQYLSNLNVVEKMSNGNLDMKITTDRASYNDSLYVDHFNVDVTGSKGDFDTKIVWNQEEIDSASFEIETQLLPNNEIAGKVKPSYFSVKGEQWDIKQESKFDINIANQKIVVDKLSLERETQAIRLDGTLSNDPNDVVNLDLKDVHVEEFSKIFAPETDIVGRLDGHASLSTPFTTPQASGEISLTQFYMNKTEIGDVIMDQIIWNPVKESMILNGKLAYLDNAESIKITGTIYPFREQDNYKVAIEFKNTDLKFVNAFMDPSVVSGINGNLRGKLNITGVLTAPEISGKLDLVDAGAKIGILGTTYSRITGKINFDGKNDFISAALPVYDSDGNVAIADLQISHTAFKNLDINLDFWFDETVSTVYKKPYKGRFMVLNTVQKEGDIYYGKAYASGNANIAIHETVTEIEVHAQTEDGTVVNLPLYGISDVSEFDFIEFEGAKNKDEDTKKDTGLELSLFLDVTNEAEVNLIFNPKTGDAIKAFGYAKPLEIQIRRDGSLSMTGTYTFSKSPEGKRGGYDFNLPPIKERFDIKEGGTVAWSGSAFNARMDVTALKTVVADMNTLADDGSTNGSARKRKVECIMMIGGDLNKPTFDVGLELLDGNPNDKALLNRATTTPDDTQKQWFKLLATHSFAPLNGGGGGGGATGGVNDLLGQYMNSVVQGALGENVGFDASGGNSVLTFQKNLGKNVIVKGSGGVAVDNTGQTGNTSSLMGDMSIDVLLNDDGTFKMTIFNEPNGNNALASKENGDYTQGIGLSYSEEFNQTKDSRLLNTIKDPLNRKGLRKKRNKNKVPASSVTPIVVAPKPPEVEKKPATPAQTGTP